MRLMGMLLPGRRGGGGWWRAATAIKQYRCGVSVYGRRVDTLTLATMTSRFRCTLHAVADLERAEPPPPLGDGLTPWYSEHSN